MCFSNLPRERESKLQCQPQPDKVHPARDRGMRSLLCHVLHTWCTTHLGCMHAASRGLLLVLTLSKASVNVQLRSSKAPGHACTGSMLQRHGLDISLIKPS